MKKRLLSAFLAVMMMLTMAPVAFAVDGVTTSEPVAQVGENSYATLAEAVNAAQTGATVTMLANTTDNITVTAKDITLDMAGKTLTLSSDCGVSVVGASSKLTITGNGVMNCEKTPIAVSEGTVVIENGTITSTTDYCTYARDGGTIIVNGGTLTSQDAVLSGNNTTGNMNFLVNGGTLTAKQGPAIYQSGQCELTITGGTLNGGISLRMGQVNISGGTINATTNSIDSPAEYYNYSGNAWLPDALYVFGGTYNKGDAEHGNSLNLNITGGTFNCTNGQGSAVAIYDLGKVAQSAKINISGNATFSTTTTNRNAYDVLSLSDIGVTNPAAGYGNEDLVGKVSTAISAGTFSSDVTKYCANGTMAAEQEDGTYKVVPIPEKTITDVKAATDTAEATVNADKITDTTAKAAAKEAAQSAEPTVSDKDTAAKELTPEEKGGALNALLSNSDSGIKLNAEGKVVASANDSAHVDVAVTKVIYLDIEVSAYDAAKHTVTMDVTPKYNVVATTSVMNTNNVAPIVVSTDNDLTVTEPTTVTLELAKSFFGDDVTNPVAYVQHTKDNTVYVYNTTIAEKATDKYRVKFVTPHGFSPMTITTTAPVAKIGDVGYTSLPDAVASAANGDTIKLMANCADEIAISKNVTIECGEFKADKVTAGSGYTKTVSGTTITIAKKSSGSSGGSSSGKTTYKVTTSAVNNGGVNASPSTAEKGDTITITLSPDKGYTLGKLTVTDGSGKTVSTTKKSDTVYTFTMPASAVTVGVSYVKADETPSETKFNDVSANDWFADAVDYVTGKGMMNGTAANTFSPKANTTRGMVVTVLYRLENEPSTSAASFTDVASGAYYANAVAWANANGIVSGYGNGKFGPNNQVTREQMAAILYRYAQYKKYDVSVGEDTNIMDFDDVRQISSYAVPAIQWACGAGVMSGKSTYTLDPKGDATRAEVAAMLMRFCENVK